MIGFLILLALGYLVYSNGRIAADGGRSRIAWSLISIGAYFGSYMILASIYISIIYKGAYTKEAMLAYVENNQLVGIVAMLLGFIGILSVRYYLERSAPKRDH